MNILDTKRLFLRHLRADNADFILELLNEPAFRRNILETAASVIAPRPAAISWRGRWPVTSNLASAGGNGSANWHLRPLKRESMQDIEISFAFLVRFWTKRVCVPVGGCGNELRANLTGAEASLYAYEG